MSAPRGERVYHAEKQPEQPKEDVKLVASDLPWPLVMALSEIYQHKSFVMHNIEFGTCLRGGPRRDSMGRCIDRPCRACWPLPEGWDG